MKMFNKKKKDRKELMIHIYLYHFYLYHFYLFILFYFIFIVIFILFYLFHSSFLPFRVYECHRPDSDWDLIVVVKDNIPYQHVLQRRFDHPGKYYEYYTFEYPNLEARFFTVTDMIRCLWEHHHDILQVFCLLFFVFVFVDGFCFMWFCFDFFVCLFLFCVRSVSR
jgi:hypothetical protein